MPGNLTLRPQHLTTPLEACFSAFLLDREAARCSPKTLEHYRYTLGSFIAFLKARKVANISEIIPQDVRAYLVSLQRRGLKDTTQHAHARGIRAWFNWLVAEGDLDESPMQHVAMPRLQKRVPAPFAPQDVRALLDACDRKSAKGARDYALVLTLLDTGLRASELIGLRVGDVDMRSGLIVVMGKGQKQRQVIAGSKARAAILRMLAYRGAVATGAPLWATYDLDGNECSRGLSVHGLQTMLHRLGRRAGVMPCSPHRFRRTFALWCLRDGMDLHSLRMLMGHSDLAVLQRYLALVGEDLERAHKAHSPVDKLLDERR
ncbi:MAG: tyrosine-type recombinase/integrase [Chloroflexi bacterium]|jgi:integrase/recombinase XerC|nr:tyrosine-type recombinase/integrase [Chloroflexota bacterium]